MRNEKDGPPTPIGDDDDVAGRHTVSFFDHLTGCLGLDPVDAAHCLIGYGLFVFSEDLPHDEAMEQLGVVREALGDLEKELRARLA